MTCYVTSTVNLVPQIRTKAKCTYHKSFEGVNLLFHKTSAFESVKPQPTKKMESKTIFHVASVFGATFLCESQIQLLFVVSVQIAICCVTGYMIPGSFCCVKSLMHGLVLNYQVTLPTVLEIIMNMEAWRKRHIEKNQIRAKISVRISTRASVSFLMKIAILLIVRMIKFHYIGVDPFVLSTFLNELVMSACNYLFCFYVDLLRDEMIELKSSIQNKSMVDLNIMEVEILKFKQLSQKLYERFSICLFLNVSYDFLAFIIHLYYAFIRIVHGPWSNGTLFFNVQPAMNLSTLIITCHACSREVPGCENDTLETLTLIISHTSFYFSVQSIDYRIYHSVEHASECESNKCERIFDRVQKI